MMRITLSLILILSISMISLSMELESLGITGKTVILKILSDKKIVFFKIRDRIYQAELSDLNNGRYVYTLEVELDELEDRIMIVAYEIPPGHEELILDIPRIERVERSRIPATLIILGSDEFKNILLSKLDGEFSSVRFDTQGVLKYAIVLVEKMEIGDLWRFLMKLSRKFSFFSLVVFSNSPQKPTMLDLSTLPKNCSFVVLEKPKNLGKFLNDLLEADFDVDGWIEVEEIARVGNPVMYDDRAKVPVFRNRIFPLPDRNLALQRVSNLVMEGLLKPSDVRKCMEDLERSIAPPWIVEYIFGKLNVEGLKNLPRFLW